MDGGIGDSQIEQIPTRGPLFANRLKVYPKAVKGAFRRLKWAVLALCLAVYYLTPWLRWDRGPGAPDQAVLIDMSAPRAYFFGIEIWPQEVYFLTGLLVMAALSLFLASSLLGRVWCGYTCPQTVWTDLFLLVERWIEGDRAARIRLDHQPMSVVKAMRKTAKHATWLLIAVATGGAWVFYFNDAPTLVSDALRGDIPGPVLFCVGLLTATTYLLAGWAREQVCTYMCPWPRFQAAMQDTQSLVVTYQSWRGEKRGPHKAGTDWQDRGDCIDCGQCIAACPTGIDIRDGQQLECIGCGLCIDSCNDIMTRVGRPANLITFDTLANQAAKAVGGRAAYRLVRPRTIIYGVVLALVAGLMVFGLANRTHIEVHVMRTRAPLFVTLSDGDIRNSYTLRILNKRREPQQLLLSMQGMADGATLIVQDVGEAGPGGTITLALPPDGLRTVQAFIRAPAASLTGDSTPVDFLLQGGDHDDHTRSGSVFLGPHRQEK
jgi:cytochrome c oxidase accessory protein FixG